MGVDPFRFSGSSTRDTRRSERIRGRRSGSCRRRCGGLAQCPAWRDRSARLGGSPESGCNQTFVRSTVENRMPLPSGVHSIKPFAVAGAMAPSSRAGTDPSSRIVTSVSRFAPVATLIPARYRPSGETAGRSMPGSDDRGLTAIDRNPPRRDRRSGFADRGANHEATIRCDRQPRRTRQMRQQPCSAAIDVHSPDTGLTVAIRHERDRACRRRSPPATCSFLPW